MPNKWPREPQPAPAQRLLDLWKCADCEAHDDTTYQVAMHSLGAMVGTETYLPCPMCDGRAGCTSASGLRSLHVLVGHQREPARQ